MRARTSSFQKLLQFITDIKKLQESIKDLIAVTIFQKAHRKNRRFPTS